MRKTTLALVTFAFCSHGEKLPRQLRRAHSSDYRVQNFNAINRFHLKPKAAINSTEISSLIRKTILIFNEHNFQHLLVVRSPTVKFLGE